MYLNTTGDPVEVGTDKLYMHAGMWQAVEALARIGLADYKRAPLVLNEAKETFLFDGALLFLLHVAESHYDKGLYPESEKVMTAAASHVIAVAEAVAQSTLDPSNIKTTCAVLLQFRNIAPIPPGLMARLSSQMSVGVSAVMKPKHVLECVHVSICSCLCSLTHTLQLRAHVWKAA